MVGAVADQFGRADTHAPVWVTSANTTIMITSLARDDYPTAAIRDDYTRQYE